MRFLLPIAPILVVAAAWVVCQMRLWPSWPRWAGVAAVAGALLMGCLAPAARARGALRVALGLESRADYLARHEPTWQAAVAARGLPPESRILSQDYRGFYFDRSFTRENIFRRKTRYHEQVASPEEAARRLRAEGFSHLLLVDSLSEGAVPSDTTLAGLLGLDMQGADAPNAALPNDSGPGDADAAAPYVTIADYRCRDLDNFVRRYRLIELR